MTVRVLCFGGRGYGDVKAVDGALSGVYNSAGAAGREVVIIHGGARGADSLCAAWGKRYGLCVIRVDANWDYYGPKRGGPVRNRWMRDYCTPNYGLGFPGGGGTADMNALLVAAGVPVWVPYGLVA